MYGVRYQKQAARQLLRLRGDIAEHIRGKVRTVADDPYGRHPNATRMRGGDGRFRLRVGDWRVLCSLDDETEDVVVTKIDRRGEVYR